MVDYNIIIKKINATKHNMKRIEQYKDVSLEQFSGSDDIKDIVTHNLFV